MKYKHYPNVKEELLNSCLDAWVCSFGGCASNSLTDFLETKGLIVRNKLWRETLCHYPNSLADVKIPKVYIYDDIIDSFLSVKRRGKGWYDENQKKLADNADTYISDNSLIQLMASQFCKWFTSYDLAIDPNIFFISKDDFFNSQSMQDDLCEFLKISKGGFPKERPRKTNIEKAMEINQSLFLERKIDIDTVNGAMNYLKKNK